MLGWFLLLCVLIILMAVVRVRNANHGYTIGSGIFKRSDNNLEKDKHLDIADYQYYNSTDKLK